jgi:hypothetical protein
MDGTGWDIIANYYWRKYGLIDADMALTLLRHSQDNNGFEMTQLNRTVGVAQYYIGRDILRPLSAVDYIRGFTTGSGHDSW